ncbi:MAG TPA: hypothetical protein PLA50_03405, partial [Bacteroidia bacterium]|nr:hypothetical protein [Bacteroidia bacterium]
PMKTVRIHTLPLENEPSLNIIACPGGIAIVRDSALRSHTLVASVGPDLDSAWESYKEARGSVPVDPDDLNA